MNGDIAAAEPKKRFPIYTTLLQVDSTKTKFNRKNKFSPTT